VRSDVFDAVHGYIRRQLDDWDSMWRGMVINQMERPTGRALILEACDFAIEAHDQAAAKKDDE
jgi:hypothetical protein